MLIIFIDLEHQLILNKITYPAAVVALILLGIGSIFPKAGIFGNFEMFPHPNILSGLLAAGICFIFFMIVFLINPRGSRHGRYKMVTFIGLALAFPWAWWRFSSG